MDSSAVDFQIESSARFTILSMGKIFLSDDVNQSLLFPPSLHDWLPENYVARFLVDVVSALDLSAIYVLTKTRMAAAMSAYAPAMMVRVLLYGYATGVTARASSVLSEPTSCTAISDTFLEENVPPLRCGV